MNTNATKIVVPPTQKEASEQSGYFEPRIVVGLIAAVIVGWFAHVLAARRESRNRVAKAKDTFSVFMSRKLGEIPTSGFLDFYTKSKADIRDQVFSLIPFLTDNEVEVARLKTAWVAFSEIENQLTNDESELEDLRREAAQIDKQPLQPISHDVLKQHMERLYESVR